MMKSLFAGIKRLFRSSPDAAPAGFELQIMEPTGGKILRPTGWFYDEGHRGPTFMWTISREESANGKPYTTGVRIQTFVNVQSGTGKTPRQFILDFVKAKQSQADRVVSIRSEIDQGLFSRVGIETEEGPHHILYSLFWGNHVDIAVVSIAGTSHELWEEFRPVFDRMAEFELIDMRRFG